MVTIIPGDETVYVEDETPAPFKCICLKFPTTVNGCSFNVSCLICGRNL